jgi:L-ascorbate metabolism protein UlaG (beta-lactamase superfamily)
MPRFENWEPLERPSALWDLIKWKFTTKPVPWPKTVENLCKPELPTAVDKEEIFSTFINHSTLLIQLEKLNILTDPIFSKVAGPFSLLGPRRVRPPGLIIDELPKIDVVLISHNHYDHLDLPSVKALWKKDQPLFIVPLGNKQYLKSHGIRNIVELDWWQEHSLNSDQSIILTPARHWSKRTLWDSCKALWGGFFLESHSLKIFFAGDTSYSTHFQKIKEKYGKIDLSFLPIGAYEPRWFMKDFHMNPAEAVQAHLDLESRLSVGIHFGTFRLTDEGIDDPIRHLNESLANAKLTDDVFIAPEHGQTMYYATATLLERKLAKKHLRYLRTSYQFET